jgi:anti-anti-sigma factor
MDLILHSYVAAPGVTVLKISGDIDLYTAPRFKSELDSIVNAGNYRLIIDMEGVGYLDSTGLNVLLSGLRGIREHEGYMQLVRPRAALLRIIHIAGLSEVFSIYDTVEDALASHSAEAESSMVIAGRPGMLDRLVGRKHGEINRNEIEQLDSAIQQILAADSSGAEREPIGSVSNQGAVVGAPSVGKATQPPGETSLLPITIYLSKGDIHEQVQSAVENLLSEVGLRIDSRDDPVFGSWFRQMWAALGKTVKSPIAREGALVATHMADTRLVLAQDAVITAKLMENLSPVIESLQPTKDAVIRIGALLIVKSIGS